MSLGAMKPDGAIGRRHERRPCAAMRTRDGRTKSGTKVDGERNFEFSGIAST